MISDKYLTTLAQSRIGSEGSGEDPVPVAVVGGKGEALLTAVEGLFNFPALLELPKVFFTPAQLQQDCA